MFSGGFIVHFCAGTYFKSKGKRYWILPSTVQKKYKRERKMSVTFFFSKTVNVLFSGDSWNASQRLLIFENKKITQNEYPWFLTVFWGLMEQNDRSVQEAEHYYNIITCNPDPQANGKIWLFSVSWFTRYFTQSHNDTIILIYMQTYKVNKLVFIIWHFT